jgi:hypothetical protein
MSELFGMTYCKFGGRPRIFTSNGNLEMRDVAALNSYTPNSGSHRRQIRKRLGFARLLEAEQTLFLYTEDVCLITEYTEFLPIRDLVALVCLSPQRMDCRDAAKGRYAKTDLKPFERQLSGRQVPTDVNLIRPPRGFGQNYAARANGIFV